jgi:hypothetical protein
MTTPYPIMYGTVFIFHFRYLCLFAYSDVQNIMCCVFDFRRLLYLILPVSLDSPLYTLYCQFRGTEYSFNAEIVTDITTRIFPQTPVLYIKDHHCSLGHS